MPNITANFEGILREKQVPLAKSIDEQKQTFYSGSFQLTPTKTLPFHVAFQSADGISDVEIVYSKLAMISNYQKKAELLELFNQLNEAETAYYRICLAGDGEVYLRLLTRTTNEVTPIYEMLITGSGIAQQIINKIEALLK